MKTLIIFFVICNIVVFGQSPNKIDSVFKHYFKALDLELSKKKNLDKDKLYFDSITLDDGETIFVNKYANEAMSFFQRLTKINAPAKYTGQSYASFIDKKTLKKWKHWYIENRENIRWCDKEKKPHLIK